MGENRGSIINLLTMARQDTALREKLYETLARLQNRSPNYCFHCAKCTSGCQVMRLLENKPHEVVSLVRLGFIGELLRSDRIWECAFCLKCRERCPMKVSPADILLALRNLAVSSGAQVPEGYLKMLMSIIELGSIQSPQEVVGADSNVYSNESLGLRPAKPRDLQKFQSVLMSLMEQTL